MCDYYCSSTIEELHHGSLETTQIDTPGTAVAPGTWTNGMYSVVCREEPVSSSMIISLGTEPIQTYLAEYRQLRTGVFSWKLFGVLVTNTRRIKYLGSKQATGPV